MYQRCQFREIFFIAKLILTRTDDAGTRVIFFSFHGTVPVGMASLFSFSTDIFYISKRRVDGVRIDDVLFLFMCERRSAFGEFLVKMGVLSFSCCFLLVCVDYEESRMFY